MWARVPRNTNVTSVTLCYKSKTTKEATQICAVSTGSKMWLADTRATSHITMNDHRMTNVKNVNILMVVGDGREVLCMN